MSNEHDRSNMIRVAYPERVGMKVDSDIQAQVAECLGPAISDGVAAQGVFRRLRICGKLEKTSKRRF